MEEIKPILTNFLSSLKAEILDYFNHSYSYLKDLISYKNIDLNKKTSDESKKSMKNTSKDITKAIKTGLNTIGVSMGKISDEQKKFEENFKIGQFPDYNTFFEKNLTIYVNKILFEILVKYIIDFDKKQIENLNLFNIIPQNFIQKLNNFKENNITTPHIKEVLQTSKIYDFIDYTNLHLIIEEVGEVGSVDKSKAQKQESDILKQLQIAKRDSIETLKTPKKEIIKKETSLKANITEITPNDQVIDLQSINYDKEPKSTYLDYFGNFPSIHPEIINKIKIEIMNFLNSRIVNPDYLDLENLFYYVSILKMLNIEFPFTYIEILEIIKKYINGKMFSSSREAKPDPVNIFFGLIIFSELNLLNNADIIDLLAIEMFLESELKNFTPEKLSLNFYTLFSLRLLEKSGTIIMNKRDLLNPILNLNLHNIEEYKPSLDIYHQLALIKLIDKRINLQPFKSRYNNELKKLIKSNGSINDIITDSAKVLLIYDLLELKEQESEFCGQLLDFIINSTNFFSLEELNKDFNWRTDKLGYKVELRMLFWALLASSQYGSLLS